MDKRNDEGGGGLDNFGFGIGWGGQGGRGYTIPQYLLYIFLYDIS